MLLCCCKPPARTRHRNSLSIFFSYDIESVTFGGDFIFVQRHDGNITGCWIPPNKLYLDAVGVLREINNNNSLFLTFNQKSFKFFSLLAFLLRTLERAKCGRSIAFPPLLYILPSLLPPPPLLVYSRWCGSYNGSWWISRCDDSGKKQRKPQQKRGANRESCLLYTSISFVS